MGEWSGGQDAQGCINTGGGYNTISTANFPGQIYSRNYVTPEPIVANIGEEESQIISPIFADTPLFTTNSQPQSCIPEEDGSCNFEWEVNATGQINSSYNISVIFKSNYSNIADNETQFTTINITDNIIPTITLISPTNALKFLSNNSVNFTWQVSDDSPVLNCSIYVNDILQSIQNCSTSGNNSLNLNFLNGGKYNWTIFATDTNNNTGKSQTYNFTLIKTYDVELKKSISFENTNQYKITTKIKNKINNTWFGTILDFVYNTFISGSFSPMYWFSNTTSQGEIYAWNQSLVNVSLDNVSYSVSGVEDYKMRENYVIGVE